MVVLNHEKVAVNIPVKSNFDSNSSIVEVVVTKYFRNVVHAFEPRFEIKFEPFNHLQGNEVSKARGGSSTSMMDLQAIKTLKSDIPGNTNCVDCGAQSKSHLMYTNS